MIVDEVNIPGCAVLEPENNSPIGANRDRPEVLAITSQRVKTECGKIECADRFRLFQHGKDLSDFPDMLRVDAPRIFLLEKLTQPSVSETLDHGLNPNVKHNFTVSIVVLQFHLFSIGKQQFLPRRADAPEVLLAVTLGK
jgi:hypothetical protein